jgi:hemin uptake protein HemP
MELCEFKRFGRRVDNINENSYRLLMPKPEAAQLAPANQSEIPLSMPSRVASEELLGARGELIIEHRGREYRLRLTQSGKLILTA